MSVRVWTLFFLVWILAASSLHAAEHSGRVSWIYDGDTIKVEEIGKVRLIGIDAPEYKASHRDRYYQKRFAVSLDRLRQISRKAKEFNIAEAKGKRVRLVTDKIERDKHGRLLAYVYLPDGKMLNRQLLSSGLASVFRRFEFRYKKEFLKLEQHAQRKKLGLWQ